MILARANSEILLKTRLDQFLTVTLARYSLKVAWPSSKSFQDIAHSYKYVTKCKATGRRVTVFFDGYKSSRKDREHKRRMKKSPGCTDIELHLNIIIIIFNIVLSLLTFLPLLYLHFTLSSLSGSNSRANVYHNRLAPARIVFSLSFVT